jgi:hypothetical protein
MWHPNEHLKRAFRVKDWPGVVRWGVPSLFLYVAGGLVIARAEDWANKEINERTPGAAGWFVEFLGSGWFLVIAFSILALMWVLVMLIAVSWRKRSNVTEHDAIGLKPPTNVEEEEGTLPARRPVLVRAAKKIQGLQMIGNRVTGDIDFVDAQGGLENATFRGNIHEMAVQQRSKFAGLEAASIDFAERRRELDWFRAQIHLARRIWACWLVGGAVDAGNVIGTGNIERLILLHPHSPVIEGLSNVGEGIMNPAEQQRRVVLQLTENAQQRGTQVKWCNNMAYSLLTI